MKTTIYWLSYDTQHGMDTPLYASKAEQCEAIHEEIAKHDPELAEAMRGLPFESDDWGTEWSAFCEDQSEQQKYFNFGSQELEIPTK